MKGIRNFCRWVIDRTLYSVVFYLYCKLPPRPVPPPPPRPFPQQTLIDVIWNRVAEKSADYVIETMPRALTLFSREQMHAYLTGIAGPGLVAEFGVFEGKSINHIASRLPDRTIYGFDSFEGLQEDWAGAHAPKGHFSLGGKLPAVRPNVSLVKGWFKDTVPGFLAAHPGPFALVNVDCDTYESTKPLLAMLRPRLQPGTLIVFDEFLGIPGWEIGEKKAWEEFVDEHKIKFDFLAVAESQVALRITAIAA